MGRGWSAYIKLTISNHDSVSPVFTWHALVRRVTDGRIGGSDGDNLVVEHGSKLDKRWKFGDDFIGGEGEQFLDSFVDTQRLKAQETQRLGVHVLACFFG